MLLNIAAKGFAKKTSLGNGINRIGASRRFATSNPKINPTAYLLVSPLALFLFDQEKSF